MITSPSDLFKRTNCKTAADCFPSFREGLNGVAMTVSFIILFSLNAFSQTGSNTKQKYISLKRDTIVLDSLSLIPGTLNFISENASAIDTSCYFIDPGKGILIWKRKKLEEKNISSDSLKVSFKTFPFNFSQNNSHKNINELRQTKRTITNPFSYTPDSKAINDIFNLGGLNKNGSISRGISFGNAQDVVVNSNLNLQLSGRLSDNIDILMSASDDNIPIQPDGNTKQLQEFDKVFIQLNDKSSKLIAGDFVLTKPNGYFMNFNKKAQGMSFTNIYYDSIQNRSSIDPGHLYPKVVIKNMITASGAVSKGKFGRNVIQGVESNQGPYRLTGNDNELFIVILSGSEKVYIDGEQMTRGQDNDYVIDYNTAEIRFTPKQKITKDKRITVEFQYSDKNYARSLYHIGDEYSRGKLKLRVNYYSEQDSKNKPLQQSLSDQQKALLASVGDSLTHAVVPAIDSVAFNNTDVLYKKKDSIAGTHNWKIYLYATDTAAHFRLSFSFVGAGKGNYNQINSSANGKVFQWVMPDTVTGALRGAYEPVIQLAAPKKKQMFTAGVEYNLSKFARFYAEGAFSDYDINLFSTLDKANDKGLAAKAGFDLPLILQLKKNKGDSISHLQNTLSLNVNYELAQKNFSPIERYRSVEFDRDWNRNNVPQTEDQHIISSTLLFKPTEKIQAGYQFNTFLEGNNYNADKHNVFANMNTKKYLFTYDGSYLNSSTAINKTNFFRSKVNAARKFKIITLGAKGQYEHNEFFKGKTDTIYNGSYEFGEWESYISNPDTAKNKYTLSYKQRTDNLYKNFGLHKAAFAQNISFDAKLLKNPDQQFKFNITYRNLTIADTAITSQKPDNSLLGRMEYNFQAWKGLLSAGTYYEIGSGLELKKEFSYILVPPGQGVYTWVDYNGDGIKQLNEFEIAAYPDQATYIKVFTPTNQYITTYTNSFSQTISLKPSVRWANKKGVKKLASRFMDQAAYRVDRKSTDNNLEVSYNPFLKNPNDTSLIFLNSSLRNTIFFNQISPTFGIDHTYSDTRNKALLTSGFDSRVNTYNEFRARWNMTRQITFQTTYKNGTKTSASQFFSTRNYRIVYQETEPKISYQPGTAFRISVSYKYSEKKNSIDLGGQKAILNNFGTEIKYNVLNKGSLLAKANYIRIRYNDVENSSIAFEMLESLKIGENITWGVAYQRNLSNNMQLSLTYDARKSAGTKIINVGGAQVRAYF